MFGDWLSAMVYSSRVETTIRSHTAPTGTPGSWTSKFESPGGPIAGYSTLVFTPKRFSTDGLTWTDSRAPGHKELVKIVEGAL